VDGVEKRRIPDTIRGRPEGSRSNKTGREAVLAAV
jgi:hypothetical protein